MSDTAPDNGTAEADEPRQPGVAELLRQKLAWRDSQTKADLEAEIERGLKRNDALENQISLLTVERDDLRNSLRNAEYEAERLRAEVKQGRSRRAAKPLISKSKLADLHAALAAWQKEARGLADELAESRRQLELIGRLRTVFPPASGVDVVELAAVLRELNA